MNKKFHRFFITIIIGGIILSGCQPNTNKTSPQNSNSQFNIGINQLAEHPALDNVREGFIDGLEELGIRANIDYQNSQGDIPTATSITEKFVKDDSDLILAIATPAAQAAKQATDEIPILFSAVTDPIITGLVDSIEEPGGNISGTSDESPIDKQLQLFKDIDSSIETIGIIYNTDEENSQAQVKKAEKLSSEIGLEIVPTGVSNINDIPQAVDSIISQVDGIYTITDNMVASAINIISEKAIENKLLTIGGEASHVEGGILMTNGLDYYNLGKQTAEMAKKILIDGESPANIPVEKTKTTKKVFNMNTLESLALDKEMEVFNDSKDISK